MIDYKKYYRDETYSKEEEHFKNIFRKRFNIIKNLNIKISNFNSKILDIGASTGTFLDIFKEAHYETWGVEPSNSSKIAKKKGHKIIHTYFEKAKLPSNYFDLVVMNHTLEHMAKPEKILEKVNTLLKPQGLLLVDVPNSGGIASQVLKDSWPYKLPYEHVSQFTKNSLTKIFEETRFKVIHFESRSGIFEFANPFEEIWEALIHGKKRFFTDILNIPYDIFVTFFDAGDSMTIVGKKI